MFIVTGFALVCFASFFIAAVWLYRSVFVISAPDNALTQWLGQPYRLLRPGMHVLRWPFERLHIHRWNRTDEMPDGRYVRHLYSGYAVPTSEMKFDPPPYRVVTKDKLQVTINIVVFYRIVNLQKACYAISDLYASMETILETAIVERAAHLRLEEAVEGKDVLQEHVQAVFDEKQDDWGIQITKLDVQSITPPESIVRATTDIFAKTRAAQAEFTRQERLHTGAVRCIERERLQDEKRIEAETAKREAERAAQATFELAQASHEARLHTARMSAQAEAETSQARHGASLAEIDNAKMIEQARAKAEAIKLDQEARADGKRAHAQAMLNSGLTGERLEQFIHWDGVVQAASTGAIKFLPQSVLNLMQGMTLYHDISGERHRSS